MIFRGQKARRAGTLPRLAALSVLLLGALLGIVPSVSSAVEAPAGFDNRSNGLVRQGDMDADRVSFDKRRTAETGLGPVYNAQACSECHQNPVSGGSSQVSALRAGVFDGENFIEPPGGSLIHDRAINIAIQEKVPVNANVVTTRMSTGMLGEGYVEAIPDGTLQAIAASQPGASDGQIHGQAVMVDVLEVPGVKRIGRFGWKSQHASLLSFCAEAFRNEMGITNSLFPEENTSNGRPAAKFDKTADPENNGWEVALITEFVRATKAPPRDLAIAKTPAALAGEKIFADIGCSLCHVASLTTAKSGTSINGGAFIVPAALAGKTIHPFSDFLLHEIGTGDGIVQNGGSSTRNKIRTAPLWGLRMRNRLLHDGSAPTVPAAIARHGGEAQHVIDRYAALPQAQKNQLIKFLGSL